jgi:hypothetical protein
MKQLKNTSRGPARQHEAITLCMPKRTHPHMSWSPATDAIGTNGFDGGIIVADYEHGLGARLTLEQLGGETNFAITCGIYEWFVHTRFFSRRADADTACNEMQIAIDQIIETIPRKDDPDRDAKCEAVSASISAFVDRFP